ncbi:MAG: DNA replication/repair protein RecF [Boseongicola sp.]|nr:DNA replication/repair protein RecF [Boseongicola sp.]
MSGCFVRSLTMSHFRSHKVTRLSLDSRPVVLHGANGAGKTNILEAVSLLSPGRGLRRAAAEDFGRHPEALGWKISAEVEVGGQLHELETSAEPGQSRTVRVDGKVRPQIALGHIARIVWLVPAMDRLWLEGAEGRRRFLDRMTMSFVPEHANVVLAYDKAMRERNRLLKDMVRDAHWYQVLERQMGDAGAAIMSNRRRAIERLAQAQAGANTAFPIAKLSVLHPNDDLPDTSDELVALFDEGRTADLRAGRTLAGPHRIDMRGVFTQKDVPAEQCSTGEQKAMLISLVLANARALAEDTGSAPLILLDEVAAHLDSVRRRALYDEICGLGAQAWMTGTGPELFDDLGARAQVFEVFDGNDGSEVRA